MQACEQKMRACTGKGECQNGQRSVHRELADFPDSGTPCRQFGVQEQPHDALVQLLKFSCTCEPGDKIHWKKTQTEVSTAFALPQMCYPFFPKCIGHHC